MRLSILLSILLIALATPSQGQWPSFRGDRKQSGVVTGTMPRMPKLAWVFNAAQEIKASPVAHDGRIVVGTSDGNVLCLSKEGKKIWEFATGNTIEAPALVLEGRVYIGNLSGSFFALDLATGRRIWEYKADGQISAGASWWRNGGRTLILVGSYDYHLHAIDASTGRNVWKYELTNYLNSAVAVDGNEAIFGGCDGLLHVVDLTTGKGRTSVEVATYIASSPSLRDGKAFVGDYDGRFTSIDYRQGRVLWAWQQEGSKQPFIASPSVVGRLVVIGSRDRFVYGINANTGKLVWQTNTGSRVDASTIADSQKVLAVNMRGDMLLLSLKDGSRLWSYELGGPVIGSPAFANGSIIVAAQDGNIYLFR